MKRFAVPIMEETVTLQPRTVYVDAWDETQAAERALAGLEYCSGQAKEEDYKTTRKISGEITIYTG